MLFTKLNELLKIAKVKKVNMSIEDHAGDSLRVTITTVVEPVDENLSAEAAQLRAALVLPLRVIGTPEKLDAELVDCLKQHAQRQHTSGNQFQDALERLKENTKSATAKAKEASTNPQTKPTEVKNETSTPASTAQQPENAQPDSAAMMTDAESL